MFSSERGKDEAAGVGRSERRDLPRHPSVSMSSAFVAALIHPMSSAPISRRSNCDCDRTSGRTTLICSRQRRSVSAVTPFFPRVGLIPRVFNFVATALLASAGESPTHSSRWAAPTAMPTSA